ncbi:hypothetical protein I4U23_019829 [Adineta vaga]|nr:hypothetical protein I4U23_019829 [Adineta vaga]
MYIIILLLLTSLSTVTNLQVCKWYGIAPFCFLGNSCPENCWHITSHNRGDGATCWLDEKKYCCYIMTSSLLRTTILLLVIATIAMRSVEAICSWHGIAPFCFVGNSCPDGCLKTLESNKGDGLTCWFSHKNYCCCTPKLG